ncbi:MAG: hypothetical protein HRU02_14330 [Myxococcales bacterium]|nr:hypothetical protein [Myxococcales bacterium]
MRGRAARLLALALLLSYSGPLRAQVVFDDSFGLEETTALPGEGFDYAIYPSSGKVRGTNLFHSFSSLSIGKDESAGLLGAGLEFENVVLRVPHAVARVDGTLVSDVKFGMDGARVVVMAPEGIVFGDSALLRVAGELILSTADQLRFGDDTFFHSSTTVPWSSPEPELCCMGDPIALGFEAGSSAQSGIATIQLGSDNSNGIFAGIPPYSPDGSSAALLAVAERIELLDSRLSSRGGTIYVAATGRAAAWVPLDPDFELEGSEQPAWWYGVGPDAAIQVSGSSKIIANPQLGEEGRVIVRGGSLVFAGAANEVRAGGDTPNRPSIEATAAHSLELRDGAIFEANNPGAGGALGVSIRAPRVVIDGPNTRVVSSGGSALTIDAAESLEVNGATVASSRGGSIGVGAKSLEINSGNVASYGSGSITIDADEVALTAHDGPASIETLSLIIGDFKQNAGNIAINAHSLALRDKAQIRSTSTQSGRNAGNITLTISDLLAITGVGAAAEDSDTQSAVLTRADNAMPVAEGEAQPGTVTINVDSEETRPSFRLEITDAGVIETLGGGDIVIAAGSMEAREGASVVTVPGKFSEAGDIGVWASALSLENGGQIRSTTDGEHGTGDLNIIVDGALRISGVTMNADNALIQAAILARTGDEMDSGSRGSAGKITLVVGSLDIAAGGLVSTSSFGVKDLDDRVGAAGAIVIDATGDVRLAGASDGRPSEIAARTIDGSAGDITLNARSVSVHDGAGIFASSFGSAPGGSVNVKARQDIALVDASVTAISKNSTQGGDVSVNAGGHIVFQRSVVETNVKQGEGSGGNIRIGSTEGPRLFVLQDSDVTATAQQGAGGNIDIVADILLQSADSSFDASSAENVDGSVEVAAPVVQVEGRLDPLPASFLDVRALLLAHCALRHAAGGSSFVIEEGPPPPPSPRGYLASPPRLPASAGSTTSGAPPSVARQLADFDGGCARGGPRERPPRAVDTAGQRPPSRPQLLALSGID